MGVFLRAGFSFWVSLGLPVVTGSFASSGCLSVMCLLSFWVFIMVTVSSMVLGTSLGTLNSKIPDDWMSHRIVGSMGWLSL